MKTKLFSTLAAALSVASASMASVTFNLSTIVDGTTPSGPEPYMTATMDGNPDTRIEMHNNMREFYYADTWLFKVKSWDMSIQGIQHVSGPVAEYIGLFQDTLGQNDLKAGIFNLEFRWATSDSSQDRFDGGETSVYVIYTTFGHLNSDSFNNVPSGPSATSPGGFASAAHFQGRGIMGTVAAVPEPAGIMLLTFGLLVLVTRWKHHPRSLCATLGSRNSMR